MGSYYKHTKTASVDVPFSFRCEQCMKDSGPLMATISAQAEINSSFKNLDDKQKQKLNESARDNLVKAVKRAHRNAVEKQIYKSFNDECPHCHKPQSWAVSGVKSEMFTTPIVWIVLGIILGAGSYFLIDDPSLMLSLIVGGVCFAAAAGVLIWNIIKVARIKKQTSTAAQKNLPVIEWSAVQHFLNQ